MNYKKETANLQNSYKVPNQVPYYKILKARRDSWTVEMAAHLMMGVKPSKNGQNMSPAVKALQSWLITELPRNKIQPIKIKRDLWPIYSQYSYSVDHIFQCLHAADKDFDKEIFLARAYQVGVPIPGYKLKTNETNLIRDAIYIRAAQILLDSNNDLRTSEIAKYLEENKFAAVFEKRYGFKIVQLRESFLSTLLKGKISNMKKGAPRKRTTPIEMMCINQLIEKV